MMAIFFSRPLTLTINSFDIFGELSPEKTASAGWSVKCSGTPRASFDLRAVAAHAQT
jgi:hypothetical protein